MIATSMLSQRNCPLTARPAAGVHNLHLSSTRAPVVAPSRRTLRRQTVTYAVEEQKDQAQQSAPVKPDIAKVRLAL